MPTASLIGTGTTWKYLDDNTDPAAGSASKNSWAAPAFDDSAWKQAVSGFGVKNGQLTAVGPYTPATKLEHYINGTAYPAVPTYFFRTTFELDAGVAEQLESASASIVYDDAVRVYVNGEKVANFRDGDVDDALETNQQYAGENGGNPVTGDFEVPGALLQDGTITIAIALYQDRSTSSDAYFDLTSFTLNAKAPGSGDGGGSVVVAATPAPSTPTQPVR